MIGAQAYYRNCGLAHFIEEEEEKMSLSSQERENVFWRLVGLKNHMNDLERKNVVLKTTLFASAILNLALIVLIIVIA